MMAPESDGRSRDDDGTLLEPLDLAMLAEATQAQRTLVEPLPAAPATFVESAGDDDVFRPVFRPPTARLVLLDDGESVAGETVRLRESVTLIGRTEGHIRVPHDVLVSAKHAEIVREGQPNSGCRWILRDLGSSNGTYVQCKRADLYPDRMFLIGGRRFQFVSSTPLFPGKGHEPGTVVIDARTLRDTDGPRLIDKSPRQEPVEIPLRSDTVIIGRRGHGNEIDVDDPLVARHHARLTRGPTGLWVIEALRSRNGLWVRIDSVRLMKTCRFQCGEQRFLFVS